MFLIKGTACTRHFTVYCLGLSNFWGMTFILNSMNVFEIFFVNRKKTRYLQIFFEKYEKIRVSATLNLFFFVHYRLLDCRK